MQGEVGQLLKIPQWLVAQWLVVSASMSPSPAARPRATPLRAALLALTWSLPGVWCAGHLVAHELESGHYEEHAALASGDRITGISHDHDHGHHHPDTPPAVSAESTKKLDTPTLLTAAVVPDAWASKARSLVGTSIEHAASHAPAVSRPRAPPIS